MEAPLCKICGERHYSNSGCFEPANISEERIKRIKHLWDRPEDRLDPKVLKAGYNAYMRDYMQKRRAKDKAK